MVCVQCGGKTQIINSRPQVRSNQTWRRRKCLNCNSIFSTVESADYAALWAVRSASGTITPFSSDKLLLSLYNSCQHREKALIESRGLTDTVIAKLIKVAKDGQLTAKQIADAVQVTLNRFDKVASVHYQAFHRNK